MRVNNTLTLTLLFICLGQALQISDVWGQMKIQKYRFKVDLTQLKEDRLQVELRPPRIKQSTIVYYIPKIVPGIYGALDFGQYVSDFQALTASGKKLKVERIGKNGWKIWNAQRLFRVVYKVDDAFESHSELGKVYYNSAASNFTDDEVFVINHNCLFGYFVGMTKLPIELTFTKPKGFYGATSMNATQRTDLQDVFLMKDYRSLVDAPLMYSRPDTVTMQVANTKVMIAVHSKTGKKFAKGIAKNLKSLLEGQKDYLGGRLPVDHYTFIISHGLAKSNAIVADALEHSYSSLYLFAALNDELDPIASLVRKIASHEFFHIITPLNIHSEKIANYDFNHPKMSEHLWLYEGMTEYATIHMPIKQKMQGISEFFRVVRQKIVDSRRFNNHLSFTQMSKNILKQSKQYYNVYLKGALIGMCLDIRLRELSKGKYGTQNLMQDLANKYGKHKPFKDSELITEITKMTYPEIQHFFTDHVINAKTLPIKEYLFKVGIQYDPKDDHFRPVKNITAEQKKLRKAWIGM
ncbi:MAG TPA: peptidase M61 [Microscillaceae bacterium]|nr:peptidase M61 [Microscillaceae bacterium]